MTAMPADTLKDLYQAGTTALGWLNSLMGLTGSGGIGAGIIGVASALRSGGGSIAAGLGNILGWHMNPQGGITRGNADWVNAYNRAFKQTENTALAYDIASQATLKNGRARDGYTQKLYDNSNGLIDASKVTGSFGSTIKSFAKNALTGMATFAAIELAMTGINAMINAIEQARPEALMAQADASYASMQASQKEADTISEERVTAQSRITELETKGQATALTTEEQAELMDLRSQVRTLQYQQSVAEAQAKGSAVNTMRQLAAAGAAQTGRRKTSDRVLQTTETAQQDFADAYEALTAAIHHASSELDALDHIEGRAVKGNYGSISRICHLQNFSHSNQCHSFLFLLNYVFSAFCRRIKIFLEKHGVCLDRPFKIGAPILVFFYKLRNDYTT